MLEIRGHARGGQGMVTAFEMLAKIFAQLGDFQVQAFPAFGVERTGAPIQAFLRVGKGAILNRSNIYHPNLIVVFDESLLAQVPVFNGLHAGGVVLLNTGQSPGDFEDECGNLYTVPATRIALELGLGSKSLPIVNAAMIGAMMRLFEADLSLAEAVIRANVPAKPDANAAAARRGYDFLLGAKNAATGALIDAWQAVPATGLRQLADLRIDPTPLPEGIAAPRWSGPLSVSKTGNWRLLTPEYQDRTPPCNAACPAGTDVRELVKLISQQKFDAAGALLYEHNPFPAVCGRVCPHFCEQQCNRRDLDSGLNIGALERFVGDRLLNQEVEPQPLRFPERIAVIGGGPAGLTAALRLRDRGYSVTVFEALPRAGGMMRAGIPRFRLPDPVLDEEIRLIEKRGVRIECNRKVTVDDLAGQYQAVIVAVGAHQSASLGIEGEELAEEGIRFLRQFKLEGSQVEIKRHDQVAIIGGGNTAIDVARTVLRLGANPTIYYRRTIREMPAIPEEVKAAMAEGVKLRFLTAPTALAANGDGQIMLTVTRMQLGEADRTGRRRPEPLPGTERNIPVDKVIAATGQYYDASVFNGRQVKPAQGRVTFESDPYLFCAGDMAWGGTVTEAIGSGNRVAEVVHAFLRDEAPPAPPARDHVVSPDEINFAYYLPAARQYSKVHHPRRFYGDFAEVVKGLSEAEVVAEAGRCLHCGDCFDCGNCLNFCPDAAIYLDDSGRPRIDYDYCKGCGICQRECPCSAIAFQQKEATP